MLRLVVHVHSWQDTYGAQSTELTVSCTAHHFKWVVSEQISLPPIVPQPDDDRPGTASKTV